MNKTNYPYTSLDNIYSVNSIVKIFNDMKLKIPDGNIPEEEFTSTIEQIQDKNNPIIFVLKNGCKLFFTYPEYRRLHGKPELGKNIKYSLQKVPLNNLANQTYMIKKCIIF